MDTGLNPQIISEAEKARLSGNVGEVYSLLCRHVYVDEKTEGKKIGDIVSGFTPKYQELYLEALRILFGAIFSALKRSRTPSEMVGWAKELVELRDKYYLDEKIKTLASVYLIGANDAKYPFYAEMQRDLIRLSIFALEIFSSNNSWKLDEEYQKLAKLSPPGSLMYLGAYERERAIFNAGYGDPSRVFSVAQTAWKFAFSTEKNYERAAAISCNYFAFTLRLIGQGCPGRMEAVKYWLLSARSDGRPLSILLIFPKEIGKMLVEPFKKAEFAKWRDRGDIGPDDFGLFSTY